ncbi:MAG: hypothetical protein JNM56_14975 [Planctomycetia bacterium]|nr:hypothetical protein [Planctomycetia bacterium]
MLCSTLRLLDAELALAANDEARWFGLRAHWLRTYQIEQTCRQRMEAGRLPFKEHLETLYHRRDAELWLKQFLTDKKLPVPTPLRFRLESRGCP